MAHNNLKQAIQPVPEVSAYKAMLSDILARRPSGTKQRLAARLNKSRSFVSLITNPAYDTPIPAGDVGLILEAAHVTTAERKQFMGLYALAHPRHFAVHQGGPKKIAQTVYMPDFGDAKRNAQALKLLSSFVSGLAALMKTGGRDEETDE